MNTLQIEQLFNSTLEERLTDVIETYNLDINLTELLDELKQIGE